MKKAILVLLVGLLLSGNAYARTKTSITIKDLKAQGYKYKGSITRRDYMPIPPIPPGGIAGPESFSSGLSAIIASVVINKPAIEDASIVVCRFKCIRKTRQRINKTWHKFC